MNQADFKSEYLATKWNILRCDGMGFLMNKQRHSFHSGISRIWKVLCWKPKTKTKYIFVLYHRFLCFHGTLWAEQWRHCFSARTQFIKKVFFFLLQNPIITWWIIEIRRSRRCGLVLVISEAHREGVRLFLGNILFLFILPLFFLTPSFCQWVYCVLLVVFK